MGWVSGQLASFGKMVRQQFNWSNPLEELSAVENRSLKPDIAQTLPLKLKWVLARSSEVSSGPF
eukprot:10845410-Alexandrium_andersonii.AAC.1